MASGLGSIDAPALAAHLTAYNGVVPAPAATTLTAVRPAAERAVAFGDAVVFSGQLTEPGGPIAGAPVWVQGADELGVREWRTLTDAAGRWSITLTTQVRQKLRWRVVFMGGEHLRPAIDLGSTLRVVPRLGAATDLPVVGGQYAARPGRWFRVRARTWPALTGRTLLSQYRRVGDPVWHRLAPGRVGYSGRTSRLVRLPIAGRFELRWRYDGSTKGRWLSSASPARLVIVRR